MNDWWHFIREKTFFIGINLVVFIILATVLHGFYVSWGMIGLIFILWFFPLILSYILDFLSKNKFYQSLEKTTQELEHKYLLPSLVTEPDFWEGQIVYNTLVQTYKSMHEEVNTYKLLQEDYKEFIEMWVHEIKTPISAAQLLLANKQLKKEAQFPEDIALQEEISSIETYVEQVLYYARSTQANKDYIIKQVNLKQIVNATVRKYSKRFIYQKVSLSLQDFNDLIYTDIKWLEYILGQILINALHYTRPDTPKISIYTQATERTIILTIEDNGIGISEKDLPYIFNKGFTGENGRYYKQSTGMGLYLCKELANKLYMGLEVESTKNIGTKVHLIFPKNKMVLLE